MYPQHLELTLSLNEKEELLPESITDIKKIMGDNYEIHSDTKNLLVIKFNIPVKYKKLSGKLCIIRDGEESETDIDKQKFYPEDKTFIFIAKSFYWNKQIRQGEYNHSVDISKSDNHTKEYVKRSLRQHYLSPKIIEKITSTKGDKQIGVEQLMGFNHWCWKEQEKALLN